MAAEMTETTGTGVGGEPEAPRDDFPRVTDPYRRELFAHCYRMVGSVHDAEDLVQETYLRAWKAYHRFEGRSSVRTWLHRIATNVCLTSLEGSRRRPLPTGLGAPGIAAGDPLVSADDIPWLEPVPDSLVADPADHAAARESVRLAFVAALQHLPPRHRAVLLLRDVLAWPATEVAEALDLTPAAVNSILQRARARLERARPVADDIAPTAVDEDRELLARYVAAFWEKDIEAIVALLKADAVWEMPPYVGWYQGAQNIGRLIDTQCPGGAHEMPMVATRANGQPSFGLYMRRPDGTFTPFHLQVLTVVGGAVAHVAAFFDTTLFGAFGLPDELHEDSLPTAGARR